MDNVLRPRRPRSLPLDRGRVPHLLGRCLAARFALSARNRSRLIAIASRIGSFSPHLALLSKQHRSHYARERIVSTTNRNFEHRQGPKVRTHLVSPATAAATALAFYYPKAAPLAYAVATAVGMSRVHLGVHFPSDAAVGGVIGIGIGTLCAWAFKKRGR